jgi:hypothetical protein
MLLSLEKSKSRKDVICVKILDGRTRYKSGLICYCPSRKATQKKNVICVKFPDGRTQYKCGLMCFCPSGKATPKKKWNLCKNPGCQVWPHVLLSLKKSKSGKKLIFVKIPDARTQYKSGLMCFCPSRKASPEKT